MLWRYFENPENQFKINSSVHNKLNVFIFLCFTLLYMRIYMFMCFFFPIVQHLEELRSIEWESVIIDESQCTEISSNCAQIKLLATKRRLLLVSGQLKVSIFFCFLL